MLDQQLILDEHITLSQTKIPCSSSFLKYAKKFQQLQILKIIYNGVVEPRLRCCCFVWESFRESKKKILKKLQNRAARIVINSSCDASASQVSSKLQRGLILIEL